MINQLMKTLKKANAPCDPDELVEWLVNTPLHETMPVLNELAGIGFSRITNGEWDNIKAKDTESREAILNQLVVDAQDQSMGYD